MVSDLRLAFQVIIAVGLSVGLGLAVAFLSFGPYQPFPFSECSDYQFESAPASCRPLAPVLLLLAICLLVLAAVSLLHGRSRRKSRDLD